MKIGILTYHFANNYGAVLQVFAMQSILKNKGIEAEIIDFQSDVQRSHHCVYETPNSVSNIIKNMIRLPHYKSRCDRIRKFNEFRKDYMNISNMTLSTEKDVLTKLDDKYDLIFVGSDQVWNPNTLDFNSIYFKVSSCKTPAVTYAASSGNAKLDILSEYLDDMKKFKSLSMREKSGMNLINGLDSDLNCKNVLDPTLLIETEEYERLASKGMQIKGEYILCYYLGRKNSVKVVKVMNSISKRLGKPVYFINANYGMASYGKNRINNAGPQDFASLIKNASIVFTNSFHATAISIKMGVPFYNFEESGSNDNRKKDLLLQLGIKNRSIIDYSVNVDLTRGNEDILSARDKIAVLSKDSIEYINKCLEGC